MVWDGRRVADEGREGRSRCREDEGESRRRDEADAVDLSTVGGKHTDSGAPLTPQEMKSGEAAPNFKDCFGRGYFLRIQSHFRSRGLIRLRCQVSDPYRGYYWRFCRLLTA